MADKIIFVHGWGFDSSFWDGVRAHLDDYDTDCVDLGFFGYEKNVSGDIYITHSMGLAWALQNASPKALMAINGFTRFCAGEGWDDGVATRMLARMIRQFEKSPETVWCDFMKNSGLETPEYPVGANETLLCEGLKDLQHWDVREAYSKFMGPKCLISSKADRIVPEKLTTASFGNDVIWYIEGNHLLALSETQKIAEQIRRFVDSL